MAWKRDQISYQGLSIQERFNVWILNLVSRFVGFTIKIIFFFVYLIFMTGFGLLVIVGIVVWLALPLIVLGLVIFGILELFLLR